MTAPLRLIFRGDDMGSARSANVAGHECVLGGVLRNVGVMVPGPAFAHAAELFADASLPVSVGLQVTLSAEWDFPKWGPVLPEAEVPSLVGEDGYFTPSPHVLHDRKFSVKEALAEIEAQIDRALACGLPLGYIDEHMGVSWADPALRAGIAALAERHGLVNVFGIPHLPDAPTRHPDLVDDWIARLEHSAANGGGTFVVVTHPTHDDEEMRGYTRANTPRGVVARQRNLDRRALLDPRLLAACDRLGVECIRYRDLKPGKAAASHAAMVRLPSASGLNGLWLAAAAAGAMRWLVPGLFALALVTGLVATGCRREAGSKNDPRAEFARGWEKFREGEYDVAAESFRAASHTLAGDPLQVSARYGEAMVWSLRRPGADAERAREIFQQIIDAAPAERTGRVQCVGFC